MEVRQLLDRTGWRPGRSYETGRKPTISVPLPTFRRGKDGLLRKAIDSILSQTFADFELIIIDDASTDGSAQIIAEAMERDGRVSCLTHKDNIGLPAVSEYEAYMKSRGEFFVFAFDDYIFHPRAFERLLAAARKHPETAVHGSSEWIDQDGAVHQLGAGSLSYDRLAFSNFLANSSFIVRRAMLETVGLYDPHLAAARLCDWDLWRRLYRRYPFRAIPHVVGRELGVSRRDSLGNTYPMSFGAALDRFATDRDAQLRPAAFGELDPWSAGEGASPALIEATVAMRKFLAAKPWARREQPLSDAEAKAYVAPGRPVIGVFGHMDPSVTLFFGGPLARADHLRFISPDMERGLMHMMLLECSAVVMVRYALAPAFRLAAEICRNADIPLHYFADDNPAVLAHSHPEFADYSAAALRAELTRYKGCLAGSERLTEAFQVMDLHKSIRTIHPSFDPVLAEKIARIAKRPRRAALQIGVVGGAFREADLWDNVLPALQGSGLDFRLFTTGKSPDGADGARIEQVERTGSYSGFLERWAELGIDIVLHPRGDTRNIDYKNANVLLAALYLGAAPIVADESAFEGVGPHNGVTVVKGDDWSCAITSLSDTERRAVALDRLARFCRSAFATTSTDAALEAVCTDVIPMGGMERSLRFQRSLIWTQRRVDIYEHQIIAWREEMTARSFRALRRIRNAALAVRRRLRC